MRLGILGGTFDPPHIGHLLTAIDALEHLSLDRILLIPNSVQPLKGGAYASPEDRLRMVELLVGEDSRFQVLPIEVNRNGLSYTVDTLEELAEQNPGAQLFFLAGADVLETFSQWHRPDRILELATLAVLRRTYETGAREGVGGSPGSALPEGAIPVATRTIEVSSSEIRKRVSMGMPISGFVNKKIEEFIAGRGLYVQVRE